MLRSAWPFHHLSHHTIFRRWWEHNPNCIVPCNIEQAKIALCPRANIYPSSIRNRSIVIGVIESPDPCTIYVVAFIHAWFRTIPKAGVKERNLQDLLKSSDASRSSVPQILLYPNPIIKCIVAEFLVSPHRAPHNRTSRDTLGDVV